MVPISIGIIALQINNWNQQRIETIDRNKIIANLNAEFIQNKQQYQEFYYEYGHGEKAAIELMNHVGLYNSALPDKNTIDTLLNGSFPSADYLPSNNAIDDIIQSGKLKALNSSKLSTKLADWMSLVYTISA